MRFLIRSRTWPRHARKLDVRSALRCPSKGERSSSVSACVEQIIAVSKQTSEAARLNAQILAYYDSLSEQERREEAAWGEFAESELARAEP